MANIFDISGLSYTAKENPEWFTRALFGGRLIAGGYIRVLTGIKGDELLSQIDLNGKILQKGDTSCAWTPKQIVKLSEKTAKIGTYKINLEQCIDELENKRTVYQLSPGAQNESLPAELEAATLALVAIGLSNEIEELLIAGDPDTNSDDIEGMFCQLKKSTEAIKLHGVTLTDDNVLGSVKAVYDALPEEVLQTEEAGTLFCFCSYATRRKARAALADKNNQVIAAAWTVDDSDKKNPKIYYLGMELVSVKGLNNATLIGYDSNNALMTTDLMSDLEDIELGNFPKPNESKIFIKGKLRLGFVIPFEDEMVLWSDAVPAS